MTARRTRIPTAPLAAFAGVLVLLLASGCGSEDGSADGEAPTVVASTGIVADIVSEVAGDGVEVVQLVPDGVNPHDYAPSAKQQQELSEAELVVYVSPALEQALPLDGAAAELALAEHAGDGRTAPEGEPTVDEQRADPHFWLDPTRVAAALPALAAALAGIEPSDATGFERRAAEYATDLERLDAELRRQVETIPTEDRKLVTSHDVMGYFADHYGLRVIGAPFGLSPEAEASAGQLAELIDSVEDEDVPAVFAQQGDDPEVLRRLADEAGVAVVDDLLLESLGEEADTYVEMMRYSTAKIADALAGRD